MVCGVFTDYGKSFRDFHSRSRAKAYGAAHEYVTVKSRYCEPYIKEFLKFTNILKISAVLPIFSM